MHSMRSVTSTTCLRRGWFDPAAVNSFSVERTPEYPHAVERRWSVKDIAAGDRFDAWCEVIAKTHLAFAVDPSARSCDPFLAHVREQRLGDLALVDASVLPHRGRRTRRQVAANTRDVVGLDFPLHRTTGGGNRR